MKKYIALPLVLGSLSMPVYAESPSEIEAYLGVGQTLWDDDRNLDDSTSIELGLENPMSDSFSLEIWGAGFDADADQGSADADGLRFTAGGLHHFQEGDFRPFFTFGLGWQELDFSGFEADETLAYLGLGVKKYWDNNIVLRAETFLQTSLDEEQNEPVVRLSLGYAFGRSVAKSYPAPAPAPVVAEPAPAPVVVAEPKPEPAPAPVDTDKDGVFDADDQCPNTDAIFAVDSKGCPIKLVEQVSFNLDVKFKTNSSELTGASLAEIKELADFLTKYAATTATVEGHTDSSGKAEYNKWLSQRRADSVKAALINDYGIDASRVSAVGYGEEQPIASNDTKEGQAKNRRVVGQIETELETIKKK